MPCWLKNLCFAVALIFSALTSNSAHAGEKMECGETNGGARIALIIANGSYPDFNWPQLANAANDGDKICSALAGTGFQAVLLRDAQSADVRSALADFGERAANAETALVYYAGHGFEYAGNNYIVPVDAPQMASKGELSSAFVPMQELMDAAGKARKFSLFFMDACRTEDPIVQLRDIDPAGIDGNISPVGLLRLDRGVVFYSTAKGRPAFDDAPVGSEISPFAKAITERIETPGLELSYFFKAVGRDVYTLTKDMQPDAQYPFPYGTFYDDFYFVSPRVIRSSRARARTGAVRGEQKRAMPQKLGAYLKTLTIEKLEIEDEPLIVADLLDQFSANEVRLAAELDNPVAQYLLGYMLYQGVGVVKDVKGARQWLEKSAAQGHPGGQLELAYYLNYFVKTEPERERALTLFEASAAQDYAKALSHLATIYWQGNFGPPQQERAMVLFERSAQKGYPFGIYALGAYGDEFDRAEAELRALAAAGNPEGYHQICQLYDYHQRPKEAVLECEKGANAGFARSQTVMALLNAQGRGSRDDVTEALYWANRALNNPGANDADKAKMLSLKSGYSAN